MARVGSDDEGLPSAVRPDLQADAPRQAFAFVPGRWADLEDVVRADVHAWPLVLASLRIHDRSQASGQLVAGLAAGGGLLHDVLSLVRRAGREVGGVRRNGPSVENEKTPAIAGVFAS